MRYLAIAISVLTLIVIAILAAPRINADIIQPSLARYFPALACATAGGKWGSAEGRCVTRACYAAHDCGYWTHPDQWRNRVKLGDDIATVIFWFGEANRPVSERDWTGETSFDWSVGMCCGPLPRFSATFKDGRLVSLSPIVSPPDPCRFESASL